MRVVVLTVDQRSSRSSPDAVPDLLTLLSDLPVALPFSRTAGDEVQGVLSDPDALASALERLLRDGNWHVGVGVGKAETPLPASAPAARGPAFVAARHAVESARTAPWHVRVTGDSPWTEHLESALWLWAALLARRTPKGWEVADLLERGASHEQVGIDLGISQSAVSQRARAAAVVEGRRARALVAALAHACLSPTGVPELG